MEPKLKSTDTIFPKIFMMILGLSLIATTLSGLFIAGYHNSENLGTIGVGLVLVALSVYLFTWPKRVAFDDACLYISSGQQIQQVPLENIYKIKRTLSTMLGPARFVWKIAHTDNSECKTIKILPNAWNKNFEEFKKKVKEKNPSVILKNWSHSFDLDQ